jgi:hypothetical protein
MPTVHQTDEYMTLLTAVQAERQSKFEKAQVKRVGREVREAWLQEARMEAHRQKHNRLEKLERLRQEKMAKTKEENELWSTMNAILRAEGCGPCFLSALELAIQPCNTISRPCFCD